MRRDATMLIVSLLLTSGAAAQQTNGTTTLMQETMASAGGQLGGGNPMSIVSAMGEPSGGIVMNGLYTIQVGYPAGATALPPGTRTITVTGTVSEPAASVVVNGTAATVDAAGNFTAPVTLTEGPNTITVTATDPAGLTSTASISVTLDTQPPAMPTVVQPPAVTTVTSYTLTGTKTPGTSIWINGVEVVPLDPATTWSATVQLAEGDNVLVIVTKDAAGNPSATVTRTIVVDNLPPVITGVTYTDVQGILLTIDPNTSLPKTNFSPVTMSGQVDDSLTTVVINGVTASRSGLSFQAALPLAAMGSHALVLTATSPNGYVTTMTATVVLGIIPSVQTVQPADGTLLYGGAATVIQGSAIDPDGDALEYELQLDGAVVQPWGPGASIPWTPDASQLGLHTVTVSVRDGYGGSDTQEAEAFVVQQPVQHP